MKLVSLVYQDSEREAASFLADHGNPYGGGNISTSRTILNVLDLHAIPATYVIGADGNVVKRFQGTLGDSNVNELGKYLK